jgi:hypothetical protein
VGCLREISFEIFKGFWVLKGRFIGGKGRGCWISVLRLAPSMRLMDARQRIGAESRIRKIRRSKKRLKSVSKFSLHNDMTFR